MTEYHKLQRLEELYKLGVVDLVTLIKEGIKILEELGISIEE